MRDPYGVAFSVLLYRTKAGGYAKVPLTEPEAKNCIGGKKKRRKEVDNGIMSPCLAHRKWTGGYGRGEGVGANRVLYIQRKGGMRIARGRECKAKCNQEKGGSIKH